MTNQTHSFLLRPTLWMGVLFLSVAVGMGCQEQPSPQPDVRTRPEDLAQNPSEHVGETVVISGEVDRVFSSRLFTVGGSGLHARTPHRQYPAHRRGGGTDR
jgi:hypothetical protein